MVRPSNWLVAATEEAPKSMLCRDLGIVIAAAGNTGLGRVAVLALEATAEAFTSSTSALLSRELMDELRDSISGTRWRCFRPLRIT